MAARACIVLLVIAGAVRPAVGDDEDDEQPEGAIIIARRLDGDPRTRPARIRALEDRLAVDGLTGDAAADVRLELAELLVAEARTLYIAELDAEIAADEARHDPERRARLLGQAATFQRAFAAKVAAAIDHYTTCTQAAATWPRLPDALAGLAYVLAWTPVAGDPTPMYRRLVADYPESAHVTDARLGLAEAAFAARDYAAADVQYTQVMAASDPKLADYARYKHGWVALVSDRPQDALATFAQLALHAAADGEPILARESRKDAVRAYGHYGAPDAAFATLEAAMPGAGVELLERLAEYWGDRGRIDDALAVFADYRRRVPRTNERLAPAGAGVMLDLAEPAFQP